MASVGAATQLYVIRASNGQRKLIDGRHIWILEEEEENDVGPTSEN
jgi:hypothetical protein